MEKERKERAIVEVNEKEKDRDAKRLFLDLIKKRLFDRIQNQLRKIYNASYQTECMQIVSFYLTRKNESTKNIKVIYKRKCIKELNFPINFSR